MDTFIIRSTDNTSVSEPPKKETKLNIRRQYHEDYLNIGFSWSGNLGDPRGVMYMAKNYPTNQWFQSKLKRHFFQQVFSLG